MKTEEFVLISVLSYRALSCEQLAMLLYGKMGGLEDGDRIGADRTAHGWKSVCRYTRQLSERLVSENKLAVVRSNGDRAKKPRLPCPPAYAPTRLGARRARAAIKKYTANGEISRPAVTERLPRRKQREIISPSFLPHQFYLNELLVRINLMFTDHLRDAVCWNDNFTVVGNGLRPDACVFVPAVPELGIPRTYFFLENDMASVSTSRTADKFEEYERLFAGFFWEPDTRYVVLFAVNDIPYTEGLEDTCRRAHRVNMHTWHRVDNLRGKMIDSLWNQFDRNVEAYVGSALDIFEVLENKYLPEYMGNPIDRLPRGRGRCVFEFRHGELSAIPALYNYLHYARDGDPCPAVAITPTQTAAETNAFDFNLHRRRFFNAFGYLLNPYTEYFRFL